MNENYEIGTVRADWINNLDGYKLDYSDLHGFSLFAFLQSPSKNEIEKMSVNADLVIYFDETDGVGFFIFDFSGNGGSSAFAPSLQLDYPKFDVPKHLNCFPLNIYLIDSTKGELKSSRTVSLDEDFSKWLSTWCKHTEGLNLTLDSVKEISQRYFDCLKNSAEKRSFKIAYNTSKNLFEHVHSSYER